MRGGTVGHSPDTPAALHRIGFQGEDDLNFFRMGSWLVVAGSVPLAAGIAADVAVVFFKVTESSDAALASGLAALIVLTGLWLGYPAWCRLAQRLYFERKAGWQPRPISTRMKFSPNILFHRRRRARPGNVIGPPGTRLRPSC